MVFIYLSRGEDISRDIREPDEIIMIDIRPMLNLYTSTLYKIWFTKVKSQSILPLKTIVVLDILIVDFKAMQWNTFHILSKCTFPQWQCRNRRL